MAGVYFAASFGGVSMLVASVDTARGRDVITQSPAAGDVHVLADRGLRSQATTCELIFTDRPGQAPYTERYAEFVALCERGKAEVFSHPLDGTYNARVGELEVSANSDAAEIRVRCTFTRDLEGQTSFAPAAGVAPIAGADEVLAQAARALASLEDLGNLYPTEAERSRLERAFQVVNDAGDIALNWNSVTNLDSNVVFAEMSQLVERIDESVEALELLSNLERWKAYQQVMMLRYSFVRSAESVTSESTVNFSLLVETPQPLLSICSEVYGASEAQTRAAEVTRMNRVRTPGLIPAGTTLTMPAVSS